jgi:uncharacterized protein (TIGR00725 family)
MSAPSGRRPVVGVMGAGESASERDRALADRLGELIAREGWILLTGGRSAGVMAAANRGAKRVPGSLTLGILPSQAGDVSPDVDVAVFTGMGNARNAINVLSSRVIFACGAGGPGTASEVSLALKCGTPVVLVSATRAAREFFATFGGRLAVADTPEEAIAVVRKAGWI